MQTFTDFKEVMLSTHYIYRYRYRYISHNLGSPNNWANSFTLFSFFLAYLSI